MESENNRILLNSWNDQKQDDDVFDKVRVTFEVV